MIQIISISAGELMKKCGHWHLYSRSKLRLPAALRKLRVAPPAYALLTPQVDLPVAAFVFSNLLIGVISALPVPPV